MDARGRTWLGLVLVGAILAFAGRRYLGARDVAVAPVVVGDRVRSAAPDGDTVLLAAGSAGLLRLDPARGAVDRVIDFEGQAVTDVVADGGLVAVTAFSPGQTRTHVHLVDAGRGEPLHSITLPGAGNTLAGIHGGRVIEIDAAVRFLDAATGNQVGSVRVESGVLGGAALAGERLYVARGHPGGLLVVDPVAMAVADSIETEDWLVDVTVSGRRALVATGSGGWGLIDLDGRTYRRLALRPPRGGGTGAALAIPGGFAVVAGDAVIELDVNGQPVRAHPIPAAFLDGVSLAERIDLVRFTADTATLSCGRRIIEVPVARPGTGLP